MYLSRATPAAVLDDELARLERLLCLVAAMTGLRQGELLGLRWRDIDWPAQKIRVVYPHVRRKNSPKYDELVLANDRRKRSPKSAHSSRAVPRADRIGGELDRHSKASAFQGRDDLVFGHPITGAPLDRHEVSRRYKAAVKRALVRDVRFHDLRHTSARAWPRPESRCGPCSGPCRNGWGTPTSRRR